MSKLDAETKQIIASDTGIPFDEIADMDWEEIDERIERKIGKRLTFHPCNDLRLPMRGSVLLSMGRLLFMSEVEQKLEKVQFFTGRYK